MALSLNTILHGKHQEILKDFPENYFDSCVADPPYGISFMNQHWDYNVPTVEDWKGILRVMKPGAHLLCACGTRTQHRMAVNIEDAGFEIRDVITWHYGSGFPKSLDISKAIDKNNFKHEVDLTPFGNYIKEQRLAKGYTKFQLDEIMGTCTAASWWEGRKAGVQLPGKETYERLKTVLELDNRFDTLIDWAEAEREIIGKQLNIANKNNDNTGRYNWNTESQERKESIDITTPATEAAKQWEGYGTALKPATEFWTLARKPLSENTVAANVLKWGVGGINIDGCRIETDDEITPIAGGQARYQKSIQEQGYRPYSDGIPAEKNTKDDTYYPNTKGRFPANVIFDEFTGKILDEQSGLSGGGEIKHNDDVNRTAISTNSFGVMQPNGKKSFANFGDEGGASRFFKNVEKDNFQYCELCQNKINNALNAELNLNTIHAIVQNIVPQNVSQTVSEKSVRLVKNVGSLCDLCAMNFVQEVAKISSNYPASQAIQDFITNSNKCILLQSLVQFAAQMENIDTTQITTSLLKLFGYAYHAIDECIKKDIQEAGEQKLEQSRFRYTAKADNYERNKGLEKFTPIKVNDGRETEIDNAFQRGETLRKNTHPTVKPIDLMRYLVKLITPKKGICLDPYCGSGTTLIGCKLELINFIGIDKVENHCRIAEARLAAWNPDKYIPQTLF